MNKRKKTFNNNKEINHQLLSPILTSPLLNQNIPDNQIVLFPKNAKSHRSYNFSSHYGKGFDAITIAVQQVVEILLSEDTVQVSTITSYCHNGFKHLAGYLMIFQKALKRDVLLSDINYQLLQNYIQHLKVSYPNGVSAKSNYDRTKSLIVKMQQFKWIKHFDFPANPFPNSNRKMKGEKALSKAERKRVAQALKNDVNQILKKTEPLTSYELTVCLLGIALRSGMNTTPLLEMTIDSIQEHPLKENRKLLVLYKRRGNSTNIQSLRYSNNVENVQTVLADVAVIVEHIIISNQSIRAELGSDLVFTYKPNPVYAKEKISTLTVFNLRDNIRKWVERNNLEDDCGDLLSINVSRLRKTFENRIYELSNGDAFITAKLCNHSLRVSDQHYLQAPIEAKKQFNFMGKIRVKALLDNVINIEDNTPVSKCSRVHKSTDKNGQKIYCTSFLNCVRCQHMVVTKDDLYRLFSFYWLIVSERSQVGAKRWKQYFAHIIRIIDQQIAPKFDKEHVQEVREKAKNSPHPAWKTRNQLEEIA